MTVIIDWIFISSFLPIGETSDKIGALVEPSSMETDVGLEGIIVVVVVDEVSDGASLVVLVDSG